jgi:predicted nucleic acid-binding Zn ribbon protein
VHAGAAVDHLVDRGGWRPRLAVHGVTGRWDQIVGDTLATHSWVESFSEGVLVVRCDSTAWATQLRLLLGELRRRLDDETGPGTVTSIEIKGPDTPSWVRGPRRVKGRGPRDTYG